MRKFLIYSAFLLTLYSVVFAAAAALDVDGGTIQAFAHEVSIPVPASTSLEASITAQGFRETVEDGEQAGVSGQVCVTNSGEQLTQELSITGIVLARQGLSGYQPYLLSRPVDVSGKPVLAPGETHCYPYRIEFEPLEGARYHTTAIVTIRNHSGWLPGSMNCPGPEPCLFGPVLRAGFDLPEAADCRRARLLPERAWQEPAAPGAAGTYRWRLENSGSCAWDGRYRVAFHDGDELGAARQLPLVREGQQVEPGQELEVIIAFRAPEAAGVYQGEFRLLGPDGEAVAVDGSPQGSLWLQVVVAPEETAPTAAPGPQETGTPTPDATRTAATPTGTPAAAPGSTREPTPTLPPAPAATLASTPTAAPALPGTPAGDPPAGRVRGCTRPAAFWLDHPQAWPAAALELGGRIYSQVGAVEILQEPAAADPAYRLAQELIAARLNLESGAAGPAIHSILDEADGWLREHPLDSDPPPQALERAAALAESLEAFNLGQSGPRLCPDAAGQLTPTAAPELTATPSPTPSPTPTAAAPAATGTASPAPALPTLTPAPTLPATPTEAGTAPPPPPTATGTASPTPAPPPATGTPTPEPPTPTEPASPTPQPPTPAPDLNEEPVPSDTPDTGPVEPPTPEQAAPASTDEPQGTDPDSTGP